MTLTSSISTTNILQTHEIFRVGPWLMARSANKVIPWLATFSWNTWILFVVTSRVWLLILVDGTFCQIIIAIDCVLLIILNLTTLKRSPVVFAFRIFLRCSIKVIRCGSELFHVNLSLAILRLSKIVRNLFVVTSFFGWGLTILVYLWWLQVGSCSLLIFVLCAQLKVLGISYTAVLFWTRSSSMTIMTS